MPRSTLIIKRNYTPAREPENQGLTGSCLSARISREQVIVTTEYADISLPGSPMRTFVAAPKADGQYPGIWCYSDIFQLTRFPNILR